MRAVALAALLAAAPAQAYDCQQALQTAAFKRAVAQACGYFVNSGEIEASAKACARRLGPGVVLHESEIGARTWEGTRARFGFPAACKMVLRDMRAGFVAD